MTEPAINYHLADSTEALKKYARHHFNLAIVDPPYRDENSPTGEAMNANGGMGEYFRTPTNEYWNELFRVSKHQIIWGGNYFTEFLPANNNWIVWKKLPNGLHFSAAEMAYCSTRPAWVEEAEKAYMEVAAANGNDTAELAWCSVRRNVQVFEYAAANLRNRIHPTQKPVALYKWLLKTYAKKGWKILDTHLGSGSHGIACYDLGFDLTAFEVDPRHHASASAWLEDYKVKKILRTQ